MTAVSGFADAHLHPLDPGLGSCYPDLDDAGILFGCTATESQWDAMSSMDDERVVCFYGVHPWYSDGWSKEAGWRLRSILESAPDAHVGEIGLDAKRGSLEKQMPAFLEQLDIASDMGRIANVHIVGCEKEILDAVRAHGRGCRAVVLHSFSNESYARPFSELGCMLSVNPRILARSGTRVSRLMSSIPEDRLLLETDAPYTARGFAGMGGFAERLASVCGSDAQHLLDTAMENARRISDV